MTNKKATKKALFASAMSLLLCVTMLIGSTFAWFTDSASSKGNKIMAGNLDVDLLLWDGDSYEDIGDSEKPIFGSYDSLTANEDNANTLWEPGKTQVAYLKIKNNGNLALKYQVVLNTIDPADSKSLYEVMQYQIVPDAVSGDVDGWDANSALKAKLGSEIVSGDKAVEMLPGAEHNFALLVHMDENANNDYMDGKVEFDITVLATQLNAEEDSFSKDYDKDAENPEIITAEALAAEMTPVNGVITIDKDYIVDGDWTSISVSGQNVVIDGNGHTISNLDKPLTAGSVGQVLTIKNLTIADSDIGPAANENGLGTGAFACFKDAAGSAIFENCHLVNSSVTGNERAAGLIAYISGAEVIINNCSVENCEIKAVGGAAAFVTHTQGNATITNSKVISNKITATEDRLGTKTPLAGAVIGTANGNAVVTLTNVECSGNTVSNNNATPVYNEMIGRLVGSATLVIS